MKNITFDSCIIMNIKKELDKNFKQTDILKQKYTIYYDNV